MADFLQNASAWLEGLRASALSVPVTYRRGGPGGTASPITATIGGTEETVQTDRGISISVIVRDYLINAAELRAALALGNLAPPPAPGDQVIEADGTVYELMGIPQEGVWSWHDRYRQVYRVHAKQVPAG